MKTIFFIILSALLSGCADTATPTVHEQLRQHILEAELGSAITISFAKKPVAPLPPAEQDEATLTRQLQSSNKETRWAAAEKLSYSANKDVVLALIRAMRDPSGTQRVCVMAQALGHLKDPRALSALTQAAFDPSNRDLRLCAIRSIGMIGDKSAVPALITALKQNNTPLQTASTLARLGDGRAVQPLIDAAGNKNIRPWMLRALGELGHKDAQVYLQRQLDAAEPDQKKLIEEALWKISILSQPHKVLALTHVLLNNPNTDKRMWAAYRLGEIKDGAAVDSLIRALADKNQAVAGRAGAAIVRMNKVSLKPVREALRQTETKNMAQRAYLYAVLGYIGNQADVKMLTDSLQKNPVFEKVITESLQLLAKRSSGSVTSSPM